MPDLLEPPPTMAHLPRGGRLRLPVPIVASWSSERWAAIRYDPLVERQAVFTSGRHGRGRPLFGVMHEPRQRRAVMARRCGVCDAPLDGVGWYPDHPNLLAATVVLNGAEALVTTEPPCCEPCATWSAWSCPGIAATATGLLRVDLDDTVAVVQLIDPSRGRAAHDVRFDGRDDPAERERLGRIARRHGGAAGYVKVAVRASTRLDMPDRLPGRGWDDPASDPLGDLAAAYHRPRSPSTPGSPTP